MCLDEVKEKLSEKNELISCGWKEFSSSAGILRFQNNALGKSKDVPMDKWIEAESTKVGNWKNSYQSGFHIYSDEVDIQLKNNYNRYRRVFYRGVETIGKQDGKTVVIARWMFVPTDPDAWPPLRK